MHNHRISILINVYITSTNALAELASLLSEAKKRCLALPVSANVNSVRSSSAGVVAVSMEDVMDEPSTSVPGGVTYAASTDTCKRTAKVIVNNARFFIFYTHRYRRRTDQLHSLMSSGPHSLCIYSKARIRSLSRARLRESNTSYQQTAQRYFC